MTMGCTHLSSRVIFASTTSSGCGAGCSNKPTGSPRSARTTWCCTRLSGSRGEYWSPSGFVTHDPFAKSCARALYSSGSTSPAPTTSPPIFGGQVVEKIDVSDASADEHVDRVVVGVMSAVEDVSALMVRVHDALERFKRGRVHKIWVYRALDDGREVMVLQEIEDETSARQWIEHPDAAEEWSAKAGLGAYPKHFVGRLAHIMALDEQT